VQRLNLVKNTNTIDSKHKLGWMFCLSHSFNHISTSRINCWRSKLRLWGSEVKFLTNWGALMTTFLLMFFYSLLYWECKVLRMQTNLCTAKTIKQNIAVYCMINIKVSINVCTECVGWAVCIQVTDPRPGKLQVLFCHLYQSVSPWSHFGAKTYYVECILVSNLLLKIIMYI